MERFYTVDDVAEAFGVTRAAVYIWMRRGQLPYVQIGGRRRVRESEVLKFIRPIEVRYQDGQEKKLDPPWAS